MGFVISVMKTRPAMQYILSRPGRTSGDGGDESTLTFGKYIDPIPIRGANYAQHKGLCPT